MAKERAHIIAMLQGKPMGYVKSISYTKRTFILTKNKSEAKGYASADAIHREAQEPDIEEAQKIIKDNNDGQGVCRKI